MNYLAHLYLSGEDEKIVVGNFIGDYVKGKKYLNYPAEIQKGILLHRNIDSFTDGHLKFREAKKLFRPDFGLYSGVVVDLFFDHLLAKNWYSYSNLPLRDFTKWVHAVLLSNYRHLPARVKGFLPWLIQNRRLESYAQKSGISRSLEAMSRYTSLPGKTERAIEILTEQFMFLEHNFSGFMQDVLEFAETEFGVQINRPGEKT